MASVSHPVRCEPLVGSFSPSTRRRGKGRWLSGVVPLGEMADQRVWRWLPGQAWGRTKSTLPDWCRGLGNSWKSSESARRTSTGLSLAPDQGPSPGSESVLPRPKVWPGVSKDPSGPFPLLPELRQMWKMNLSVPAWSSLMPEGIESTPLLSESPTEFWKPMCRRKRRRLGWFWTI